MTFNNIAKISVASLVFILVQACEIDSTDAECEATSMSEIHVNFRATAQVVDENGQNVDNAQVSFYFSKTPCGEIPKGFFPFDRTTINGYAESGIVGYNFQNGADYVEVQVNVQTQLAYREDTKSILASDLVSFNGQTRLINFTFTGLPAE